MIRPLREPADPRLTITPLPTAPRTTTLTLALTGELDAHTVNTLCDTAVEYIESGHRHLRLDLTGITWCDNASLYTILGLRHALHAASGCLDLAGASRPVNDAIARNRLDHVLHG